MNTELNEVDARQADRRKMNMVVLAWGLPAAILVLAIIFNYTIHRWVALKHTSGGVAALTGLISLLLWISVVFGGIFIAFV